MKLSLQWGVLGARLINLEITIDHNPTGDDTPPPVADTVQQVARSAARSVVKRLSHAWFREMNA